MDKHHQRGLVDIPSRHQEAVQHDVARADGEGRFVEGDPIPRAIIRAQDGFDETAIDTMKRRRGGGERTSPSIDVGIAAFATGIRRGEHGELAPGAFVGAVTARQGSRGETRNDGEQEDAEPLHGALVSGAPVVNPSPPEQRQHEERVRVEGQRLG